VSIESYDFKKGKVIDSRRRRVILSNFPQEDLDTMQSVLRDMRFQILGKEKDIRALLELVRKHKVGVLFMDADMPDLDVAQVVGDIKRKFPDMSVVLVSAKVDKEFVLLASKAGVQEVLASPIKAETVRKILSSID